VSQDQCLPFTRCFLSTLIIQRDLAVAAIWHNMLYGCVSLLQLSHLERISFLRRWDMTKVRDCLQQMKNLPTILRSI
jgi:hypothetical protein